MGEKHSITGWRPDILYKVTYFILTAASIKTDNVQLFVFKEKTFQSHIKKLEKEQRKQHITVDRDNDCLDLIS